jgi:flavodoxin
MKILVTFYSKTGNTKKVAEAIYNALNEDNAELEPIKDVRDPGDYDMIICGFPVHAHSVPMPVQNFLKNLKSGQKLALFSTHGSRTGGRMPREALEHALGLAKNAEILGSFTCRGEVEQQVIDDLIDKPQHKAWAMEASSAKSHPDKADLEDAQVFALGILKKALTFKGFEKR